jgi:hypothetical protein
VIVSEGNSRYSISCKGHDVHQGTIGFKVTTAYMIHATALSGTCPLLMIRLAGTASPAREMHTRQHLALDFFTECTVLYLCLNCTVVCFCLCSKSDVLSCSCTRCHMYSRHRHGWRFTPVCRDKAQQGCISRFPTAMYLGARVQTWRLKSQTRSSPAHQSVLCRLGLQHTTQHSATV